MKGEKIASLAVGRRGAGVSIACAIGKCDGKAAGVKTRLSDDGMVRCQWGARSATREPLGEVFSGMAPGGHDGHCAVRGR